MNPEAGSPTAPAPQDKEWFPKADWLERHDQLLAASVAAGRSCQLVFLGDSITEGWAEEGKEVWESNYAKYNAVNLGIGGDEVQHVTWRVQNGEVDAIAPKVAVILIGTNNIGNVGHRAVDVAQGVELLLSKLKERLPGTKLLLVGTFPRDARPGTPFRSAIVDLNFKLAAFADGRTTFYSDIGEYFTEADSTIANDVMPDHLHLSAKGYVIWATALERTLQVLMGEDAPPPGTQAQAGAVTASTNRTDRAKL